MSVVEIMTDDVLALNVVVSRVKELVIHLLQHYEDLYVIIILYPPAVRYLILSDIDRNLVYVLSLEVSTEEGSVSASVVSVSEFTTPSSFLSFCCSSAARRQVGFLPVLWIRIHIRIQMGPKFNVFGSTTLIFFSSRKGFKLAVTGVPVGSTGLNV